MEKIGINDKTDFYDNARSSRNEKAQRRVGDVTAKDIDASGWAEPTMETERKTGGRPEARAFKRGGKVDGKANAPHAGRKPRASGGKLLGYLHKATQDQASASAGAERSAEQAENHLKMRSGAKYDKAVGEFDKFSARHHKRSKGINLALDKLGGKAKVPAREPRASGGKLLKYIGRSQKEMERLDKDASRAQKFGNWDLSDRKMDKLIQREKGIGLAADKLTGKAKVPARASGGKIRKYITAAKHARFEYNGDPDNVYQGPEAAKHDMTHPSGFSFRDKKREAGIKLARSKLKGDAKVPARASGGKIHDKDCSCKMCSGGMAKAKGGKTTPMPAKEQFARMYAMDQRKREDHLKSPAGEAERQAKNAKLLKRASGGQVHPKDCSCKMCSGGMAKADGGKANYTGGTRPDGGRIAKKKGGKVKGKTHINININSAPKPMLPMDAPPPAGAMPPPAMMPKPAMPPMAGGLPPGLGVPPPAMGAGPLPRRSGGRASYKDMTAGAGSGTGRLEKTEIQKRN